MSNAKALIIDDEPDILQLLTITLSRMGIDATQAANVDEAKSSLKSQSFDICLTDMKLPDGTGMELVEFVQQHCPQTPVAVITAHGNMDMAIQALKLGAFDFVSKPIDLPKLRQLVDAAIKLQASDAPNISSTFGNSLLGNTEAIQSLRETISKLARSQAPVYISGESGTGKELVATLIHRQGPRRDGPFVPVNCGAIPSELMESEFFGHKKGAFTGAIADKQGLFQAADGGTLFLDEVADLPLAMQVKLLRAIQEKAVRPVGGEKEIPIDVRILSATHKDLIRLVEEGLFRQDLFYRINVISIELPSLRQRRDDVPLLANFLLDKLFANSNTAAPTLSPDALATLKNYHFPGNVRELENILERAVTLCDGDEIGPQDLQLPNVNLANKIPSTPTTPLEGSQMLDAVQSTSALGADGDEGINPVSEPEPAAANSTPANNLAASGRGDKPLEAFLEEVERAAITEALEANRWNKTAAAKDLGISFRAMRYRLKKLDLE